MRTRNQAKLEVKDEIVPEGHLIALFKKGSRGEIVGTYKRIREIIDLEKSHSPSFSGGGIYRALYGQQKYFASFHHQCMVKPKIVPA